MGRGWCQRKKLAGKLGANPAVVCDPWYLQWCC